MRTIVLEGPDNAGKSTLAKYLSSAIRLPIKHSGGPSKHPGEVIQRARGFLNDNTPMIYDRHPCISQNIYASALKNHADLIPYDIQTEFYNKNYLIIYCRSKGDLSGHQMSDHSTDEYFEKVSQNYIDLCQAYDAWGLAKANMIYRIGDNMDLVKTLVMGGSL